MESTVYGRDREGNLVPVATAPSTSQVIENPKPQTSETPPNQAQQPAPKQKSQRRRILPKSISRPLKIFLTAYLLLFAWVVIDLSGNMQKVDAMPNKRIADTAGTNWLLVGSDSREGLSWVQQKGLHTGGNFGPPRSDTIMIVHIGSNRKATL
ncbi:MAG: hypothetical protein EBR84_03360, partial [Actinobacteria bacterium]|nr:hypothetical protein [Actinomycetota bacterium]